MFSVLDMFSLQASSLHLQDDIVADTRLQYFFFVILMFFEIHIHLRVHLMIKEAIHLKLHQLLGNSLSQLVNMVIVTP